MAPPLTSFIVIAPVPANTNAKVPITSATYLCITIRPVMGRKGYNSLSASRYPMWSRYPTCVHLLDQQGNRPIQIFVVDFRKEPANNRHTESCRFNHPRELGLRRVQLLKLM